MEKRLESISKIPPARVASSFIVIFSIAFLAVFLLPLDTHAAFGISPPFLNADHLVRGARYVQTIYLVQDHPDEDLGISATLHVPERIHSWITIDKGFEFVIPKGVRQFPIQVIVQVPQNVDLGVYSGNLSIVSKPTTSGQVTIALGAQVVINLSIGDDIYRKYTVRGIKVLDVEEGWDPRVYIKFENEGNVPEAFSGATFDLYDQFNSVRLAYVQKSEGFEETPPFTTKEYTIEFPTDFHLGIGMYWGSASFYKEGKIVMTQRGIFNVLKRGSLSSPAKQLFEALIRNWPYVAIAGIVGVGGYVAFLVRRKKSANRA